MEGTAVRIEPAWLDGLSRAEKIEALRAKIDTVSPGDASSQVESDVLEVGLRHGLPRKAVTQASDCPALIVEMIASVAKQGGRVAVVGWPQLSLAGIEHMDQIVVIPDPGADPLGIVGVLVEGLDLVIYYSATEMNLSPVRARPLLGKVRKGDAALVLVGWKVASPAVILEASVSAYHGLGRGSGRIRGLDITVEYQDKTMRSREILTVGKGPRLRLVT